MGEIPKKELKSPPLADQEQPAGTSSFFTPNRFSMLLCASAAVLIGGAVCYAMTRPAEMRLSDVTRSPLGFDVGDLENEEAAEEVEPLLALGSSGPSSLSQPISSPQTQPQSAPVNMPARRPKPVQTQHAPVTPQKFEDPQIYDTDVDDNTPRQLLVKGPEFYQRVTMLEQEIHQLRSVLVQRERMIAQLSRELTESRARPPAIAMETPAPALEPVALQQAPRSHTVQRGDTLSEIAQRYYGTRTAWTKIYRANAEKVPDKNRLLVGVVLTIPE